MLDEKILKKMLEDMTYRGYTQNTKDTYTTRIKIFMNHCNKPIEDVTEDDIMDFIKKLKEEKNYKNGTINLYNNAIRFLFNVTLDKNLKLKKVPLFKVRRKIPEIFTREELTLFFEQCKNLKHKAIFMTIYGGGLRISEVLNLKIIDIDSKQMRIFVRDGKGEKDRYTILSEENLKILREYYLKYKPKNSDGYLFPNIGPSKKSHINRSTIERVFTKICEENCKIEKHVTVHTLRHCFATHLYEAGVELIVIQELLGHSSIRSTLKYLHIANISQGLTSPLDSLLKVGEEYA